LYLLPARLSEARTAGGWRARIRKTVNAAFQMSLTEAELGVLLAQLQTKATCVNTGFLIRRQVT